jgi:ubiquinone/menaquinone biosynthesis C-methylase UbiE
MSRRRDSEERFRERYSAPVASAMLIIEREVIGANVGANGYTTVEQADMLADRLELTANTHLLDIGSGRGWPGLYLAERLGCPTTLVDLPAPALRTALRQSSKRNLTTVSIVRGAGDHLPFRANMFDAITHTDTL